MNLKSVIGLLISIVVGALIGALVGIGASTILSANQPSPKEYNIYLDQEIKDPEQMRDAVILLNKAGSNDTINIYSAHMGGDGEAMTYLVTAMDRTKAKTVAIVSAPSYSAHAIIAGSAKELKMLPGTFLMFHTGSNHARDCRLFSGLKDRGQDLERKCNQATEAQDYQTKVLIDKIKILTADEKKYILDGYDVYLTAEEVTKRQTQGMNSATVTPIAPTLKSDIGQKKINKNIVIMV